LLYKAKKGKQIHRYRQATRELVGAGGKATPVQGAFAAIKGGFGFANSATKTFG